MSQPLKILAPTRYPWRFNGPRHSRHDIHNHNFIPFNKLSDKIEGVTAFIGNPFERYDLIHAFNRIPITGKPFIIGFESHLPRGFGVENTAYFQWMRRRLASDDCKGIIAISDYARNSFICQHQGSPEFDVLMQKLIVRYPNLEIGDKPDFTQKPIKPLKLIFVGNHFARKGGLVCLVLAQMAAEKNLPIEVEIISSLEVGAVSWTDPASENYYDHYWPMMDLPNVTLHKNLPNDQVIEKIRAAHFMMLPTFGDTFGYSAIEAMAQGKPVVATNQAALPEFITHEENGLVADIPLNEKREWVHLAAGHRDSQEFEILHKDAVYALSDTVMNDLEKVLNQSISYLDMAENAYNMAKDKFCADAANTFWDDYYSRMMKI